MVVCLEQGADLHMAQLMPLPLTVSRSSKIQIGFTFLVPAYPGCPGKEAVKWCCCCYLSAFLCVYCPLKESFRDISVTHCPARKKDLEHTIWQPFGGNCKFAGVIPHAKKKRGINTACLWSPPARRSCDQLTYRRMRRYRPTVAPPGFCNRGEVRCGSIGGLEYEVPQSRLFCLCINVALCSTALQCICRVIRRSSMTMKAHTHTHPFNGPLSGTTRLSRYQKSETNLDFTEARDSEWQWHQLGHMQVCTSLQTDNHTSTPLLSFYRPDALPAAQPTVSKH